MIDALVAGVVAGYGIALPVGAVGSLIVSLTARTSLAVGAAAGLGAATADALYAMVAVLAGSSVAAALRPWETTLRTVAALVLLGLSAATAVSAVRRFGAGPEEPPERAVDRWTPPRAYLGLLGITALNPATLTFFAALVLGNGAAVASSPTAAVMFVAAVFAASASWQLLLASSGALLGRLLVGRRGRLLTALASSAVIAALAVPLLVRS